MPQTVVDDEPVRAYRGKLDVGASFPTTIMTGIADGSIIVGNGVGRQVADVDPGSESSTGGQVVRAFQSTDEFQGVAFNDPSQLVASNKGSGANVDFAQVDDEETTPILRKGRVWVVSAAAIADLSLAVFIQNAVPGGSPPDGQLGGFTNAITANFVDLSALLGSNSVRWVAGITIGSDNFGLLELNLP